MRMNEGGVDHEPAQDPGRVNEDRLALRLAAFCLQMQTGDGLIGKAPGYMVAGWNRISRCDTAEQLVSGMVPENRVLFHKWRAAWMKP